MDRGRKAMPTLNKHTDSKYYKKCQDIHKQKLNNVKSSIDNKPPSQPSHLQSNRKKAQLREEKFSKIERENRMLLEKMSFIMQKDTLDNKCNAINYVKSLNKTSRKKELQRITQENQSILRRIQTREPTYDHKAWQDEARLSEQYAYNIREYKPILNGSSSQSFLDENQED